jgi:8-oxo-dGTP pyrophosphatase MutT (NUDIX family)
MKSAEPQTQKSPAGKPASRRPVEVSKSVGAVVLNSRLQILLVFQKKNRYWEFPKGKMEAGERELDTLQRELFEETGIRRFRLVENFRKVMHYDFVFKGRLIRRKVVYFLIRSNDRIRLSKEHTRYMWVSLEAAKRKLKHENQMKLLEEVMHTLHG